jgi:hypothetical protein
LPRIILGAVIDGVLVGHVDRLIGRCLNHLQPLKATGIVATIADPYRELQAVDDAAQAVLIMLVRERHTPSIARGCNGSITLNRVKAGLASQLRLTSCLSVKQTSV